MVEIKAMVIYCDNSIKETHKEYHCEQCPLKMINKETKLPLICLPIDKFPGELNDKIR